MDIVQVTLKTKLKSSNTVSLGVWQGAKIRSALISAIARRYCENLRYEACNECNNTTCMNKYVFYFKQDDKARMATNPIIINTEFSDYEVEADNIDIEIKLFYPATEYVDDIVDILESGIYIGVPQVKFNAEPGSVVQVDKTFNIKDLESRYTSKESTFEVKFETPMLTKSLSGVTPQQFIKNCTTRITSMVNTLGFDYQVQHELVNEAARNISIIDANIKDAYYSKMSTRTNRFQKIHGYTGTMKIRGDFSDIYPYMKMASEFNIGKQCTMGFGKFSIQEVEV